MSTKEIQELERIIKISISTNKNSKDLQLALGIIEENIDELKYCKSLYRVIGKMWIDTDTEYNWWYLYKKFEDVNKS